MRTFNIIGSAVVVTAGTLGFIVLAGGAFGATPAHRAPTCVAAAVCPVADPVLPPPAITIKCPCDLHVGDGTITLPAGGSIAVGPRTTDFSGGHWESDAPVSIDNHNLGKAERP